MEKISIAIVNWNTGKLLAQCLNSIVKLPEQELLGSVVVIDNASTDTSLTQAQPIAHNNPSISIVRSGENLGFARANNSAIKRIQKENPSHHILLLNPDTEMKPGSLRAMHAALTTHKDVGIVGPKLLNQDGTTQPSVRTFPSFTILAALFLKLPRIFPNLTLWNTYMCTDFDYTKEQVVDQVMGASFCIRNQVLTDIGLLDTRFWIWFEEVDFALRAKQKGWKTLFTPTGEVVHFGGASFHQLIGFKKSLPFINSALIYASKHFSLIEVIGLYALTPLAFLLVLPAVFAHKAKQAQTTKQL